MVTIALLQCWLQISVGYSRLILDFYVFAIKVYVTLGSSQQRVSQRIDSYSFMLFSLKILLCQAFVYDSVITKGFFARVTKVNKNWRKLARLAKLKRKDSNQPRI